MPMLPPMLLARSPEPPVTPNSTSGSASVFSAFTPRRRFSPTLPVGGRAVSANGGSSDTSTPAA